MSALDTPTLTFNTAFWLRSRPRSGVRGGLLRSLTRLHFLSFRQRVVVLLHARFSPLQLHRSFGSWKVPAVENSVTHSSFGVPDLAFVSR